MAPTKAKAYPKKQSKPALPSDQAAQAKMATLASQLEGGFLDNALKTVIQLLALLPQEPLLTQTHAQLLLALDNFERAAKVPTPSLETAYAIYKQGRFDDALQTVNAVKEHEGDSRELQLLEAQISYKKEDYQAAAHLYQELLLTADHDSPEYADLEHNLASSESFLAYKDELVASASSHSGPLSNTLEEQPVGLLVAQKYPSHRVHASTSSATKEVSSLSNNIQGAKNEKPVKLPARIAEMAEDQRPPVDPERWLPKQLRSDYLDPRKIREEERRRKQREKASVQGSGGGAGASGAQGGHPTAGGSGGQKKKGKGKKK